MKSVALVLVDQSERIYCVKELGTKQEIGKIPGVKDRSFPWETMEEGEGLSETLSRLIKEEVDGSELVTITTPRYAGSVEVHDTLAHVFSARLVTSPRNMRGSHAGRQDEIKPLGWCTRAYLLERCRDGVPDVLAVWDKFCENNLGSWKA